MSAAAYRVEVAPNNRAICYDPICKKEGKKTKKGELRFGCYATYLWDNKEYSCFRWRHWGCVSGRFLAIMRNQVQKDGDGTNFDWDNLDGLSEIGPEYAQKVKDAITKGKIADEDWNGDPKYNVFGKSTIRPRANSKKKRVQEEKVDEISPTNDENASQEGPSEPPAKKRGRATRGDDKEGDEEEAATPAKKRKAKPKKEAEVKEEVEPANFKTEEDEEAKPARKRSAKVKKEEEVKEEVLSDSDAL